MYVCVCVCVCVCLLLMAQFIVLYATITIIVMSLMSLAIFVLSCVSFDFWWHKSHVAGRVFFVFTALSFAYSLFGFRFTRSKTKNFYTEAS